MAIMCSMQAFVSKTGMCSHEKMMLGIAVLLVAGAGAYFFCLNRSRSTVSANRISSGRWPV